MAQYCFCYLKQTNKNKKRAHNSDSKMPQNKAAILNTNTEAWFETQRQQNQTLKGILQSIFLNLDCVCDLYDVQNNTP